MKWVYGYNPATKQMSQSAVLSPCCPEKPRQVKNQDSPVYILSCGGSGALWISSLMLQIFIFHRKSVFWYLDLHHSNVSCPVALAAREFLAKHSNWLTRFGPLQLLPLPQAHCHPEREKILRVQRYNWIWQGGCKPFWNKPTTHAVKSGRISSITA
jgi:hypothetical protein